MAVTDIYGWQYAGVNDPPDGPFGFMTSLEDVEATVKGLEDRTTALEAITAAAVPLDVSLYAAYGAGYSAPSYVKTSDGVVLLAGRVGVKAGLPGDQISFSTATLYTIATLPAGARPALAESWTPDVSFNMRVQAYWQLIVQPDGRVQLQHSSAAAVTVSRVDFTLSLSGLAFKAA